MTEVMNNHYEEMENNKENKNYVSQQDIKNVQNSLQRAKKLSNKWRDEDADKILEELNKPDENAEYKWPILRPVSSWATDLANELYKDIVKHDLFNKNPLEFTEEEKLIWKSYQENNTEIVKQLEENRKNFELFANNILNKYAEINNLSDFKKEQIKQLFEEYNPEKNEWLGINLYIEWGEKWLNDTLWLIIETLDKKWYLDEKKWDNIIPAKKVITFDPHTRESNVKKDMLEL